MIEIIPAILPKNYEDLKNKIALVRGIVPVVQIDICDGIFVPSKTWPFSTGGAEDYNFHRILNEEEGMPFWEDIDFEFDLMVVDAVKNFDIYTTSCDDDGLARPNGHWNGFRDYTDGDEHYDDCTSGNNAYCNSIADNAPDPFDSWPLPLTVCCSVDGTGGGVFTGFNRPDLRVR